jgi:CRP-like cAMP-binding protein
MPTDISPQLLQRFSPLDGLKRQNLNALCSKTKVRSLSQGNLLFRRGDEDKRTFFLVSGSVELKNADGNKVTINADGPEARHALSPHLPRQHDARASSDIEYLSIDSDLLDVMLTWDQTGTYEVADLSGAVNEDEDWMTAMLRTKAFQKVPAANIQAIFTRMQQIPCKAGEVIIKQGDEGDFFYAITGGKCMVVRETPLNKQGIKLAELAVGDTFGEEALISESKRNATVTMLTDGSVMRLAKEDFQNLLKEPMLDWVDYAGAKEEVAAGAQWLDVRLPSEFESFHEADAINMPLYFIRLKLSKLDQDQLYVVCCDTSRRSSAAAFILNERGFKTLVLRGGLNNSELPQHESAEES